jgi:hypothetical protein
MRSTALAVTFWAVLSAAGCSDQTAIAVPPIQEAALVADSAPTGSDAPDPANFVSDSAPSVQSPSAEPSALELVSIGAETLTVLSGKVICNTSAVRATCIDLSESQYPSRGNLYLSVAATVSSSATEAQELRMGELAVSVDGRSLRYRAVDEGESAETEIQPLAEGTVKSVFEVPIDVLNRGRFGVVLGSGEPIPFEFDQPFAQEERQAAERAEEAAQEEAAKEDRRLSNARIDKCWTLNRAETPTVSEEEFGWYVDNCSNLYDVGTYPLYLSRRGGR